MKVLVTGAAGFIGFHVVKALINRGDQVVGVDNINDYYDIGLKKDRLNQLYNHKNSSAFKFEKIDVSDEESIKCLFSNYQFDAICHLAAQAGVRYSMENPSAYISSNLLGFSNVIEFAKKYKVNNFVYASSSSVYGQNDKIPFSTNDNVDYPISLYAATKKSNELIAHSYSHMFKLPVTGLRFFTVYGPWGRPDMSYFLFVKAILNNEPITIFNDGLMSRDFTYIDDVVKGVLKVIDNPPICSGNIAPYRLYNIGNNSSVKLMDFVKIIEKALDKNAIKLYEPLQIGDIKDTLADVSDLISDLGYSPNTPIEVGVSKFIQWYNSYFTVNAEKSI